MFDSQKSLQTYSVQFNLGLWGYDDNKADLEFLYLIPALRFIQNVSHTESAEQGYLASESKAE